MRRIQLALLIAGLLLFVLLIRDVGVRAITEGLAQVGWSFLAVLAVELFVIDALHTEGWHQCLASYGSQVSRARLYAVRLAGFAVNSLTPTATVGGEVVKGLLIRRQVPLPPLFASLVVDKLTFAVAQGLFLVTGLFALLSTLELDATQRFFAIGALVLWLGGVFAFFMLQKLGMFRVGVGALQSLFGGSAFEKWIPGHADELDAEVRRLISEEPRAIATSVAFHFCAHPARALQFWIVLTALGFEPTLGMCFTAAAGLVFIEATLFLIPGKLGVYEGGQMIVLNALGFASAGLTVPFTLRLSEVASAGIGLCVLWAFHLDTAAAEREVARESAAENESGGASEETPPDSAVLS